MPHARYCKSNPLSHVLAESKYTNWMAHLSTDQLAGLLWLVGEFAARASRSDYPTGEATGGERRKVAALRAIADFRKTPMGRDDVRRYIRATTRDGDIAAVRSKLKGMEGVVQRALDGGDRLQSLLWLRKQLETMIGDLGKTEP